MRAPPCDTHGRLVLDLARGRLEHRDWAPADEVRRSCSVCGSWWSKHLEGDGAKAVEEAVAQAVTDFRAPRRRRHALWLALAAAAMLTLAGGLLWQHTKPSPPAQVPLTPAGIVEQVFASRPSDAADINGDGTVDASDLAIALRARTEKPTPEV